MTDVLRDEITRLRGALRAIVEEAVPGSKIASICYDALTDNDAVSFVTRGLQATAGICVESWPREAERRMGFTTMKSVAGGAREYLGFDLQWHPERRRGMIETRG